MADRKREVEELRQELNRIDAQILDVLDKRGKAARKLRELRADQTPHLSLQDRGQIAALVGRASGEMPAEDLRVIFGQIYASCIALEMPLVVAYLGPAGAGAHAAARARFGAGAELLAADSTAKALDEVTRKRAEFAVLPLETLSDGPVQSTSAALTSTELKIALALEVTHDLHLLSRTGNVGDVEKVYATAADHAHAQKFLTQRRLPVLDVKSSLIACEFATEDHGAAALTTEVFGTEKGLLVAAKSVSDAGPEKTRYAVVGHRPSVRTGDDTTACIFSVQDAPGALLDVLAQFASRDINLTKIQSRPAHDAAADAGKGADWAYLFFIEVMGHATDRTLVSALEEVKRKTRFFKVLGSYPALH